MTCVEEEGKEEQAHVHSGRGEGRMGRGWRLRRKSKHMCL